MKDSESHFDRVWALISAEPARPEDHPDVVGWMQRLCRAASTRLPATGVGVSVMASAQHPATMAASDVRSAAIEEVQFTVGEGPCIDAYSTGRPVLAPDLTVAARVRWPGYAPTVQELGVQAAFAFPLQIGAARLGALDVYRDQPGGLSAEAVAEALTFADAAMTGLMNAQQRATEDVGGPAIDESLANRFELYQAQGMVAIQLRVDLHEAMVRLRAYAYAHGLPLGDVADDVIARSIVLEADS